MSPITEIVISSRLLGLSLATQGLMAWKLRIQYSGAIYHVMNRGDRWEPIFADGRDREPLRETLTEARRRTPVSGASPPGGALSGQPCLAPASPAGACHGEGLGLLVLPGHEQPRA